MLSRHADAIYWLGRYMERAECTARMEDVHYHFRLERSVLAEETLWSGILAISGEEQRFRAKYGPDLAEDERSILEFFCFDGRNPSSILSSLGEARENARSIREQISTEMWECVNEAWLRSEERLQRPTGAAYYRWLRGEVDRLLAQGREVDYRAQAAADQTLDLLGAAGLLALGRLALGAGVGRARQHAVFRGDPALTRAFLVRRHLIQHAGGADDPGVAAFDQYRPFGVLGEAAGDAHWAQLIGSALTGSHGAAMSPIAFEQAPEWCRRATGKARIIAFVPGPLSQPAGGKQRHIIRSSAAFPLGGLSERRHRLLQGVVA